MYLDVLRGMTPAQRVEQALELTRMAEQPAEEGIGSRHPGYDDDDVRGALRRLRLGDALTRRAWPDEALIDP